MGIKPGFEIDSKSWGSKDRGPFSAKPILPRKGVGTKVSHTISASKSIGCRKNYATMPIRVPFYFRIFPIIGARCRRWGLTACLLSSIALFSGCAKLPPSSTSSIVLSGKRLHVLIQFSGNIKPEYYYYFLINYDQSVSGGNTNAHGPVAVLGPIPDQGGFGNGFATGSGGATADGFTDYVEFHNNAYNLFHVVPGTNLQQAIIQPPGLLISAPLPNSSNPKQLQFDIDLAQVVSAASGTSLSATDISKQALAIQWLQVNIVATDFLPTDPSAVKQVDSLGDTRTQQGQASFLNLNVSNFPRFTNGDNPGLTHEPTSENDVYIYNGSGFGDESLNIVDYTIELTHQQ